MHGLNKTFKNNPVAFMRKYAIVSPELRLHPPEKETEDFDFYIPKGADGFVELRAFSTRGKPKGDHSHPIPAFYLPWKKGGTENIELKNPPPENKDTKNAPPGFFFTASLEGCRVVIAGAHIMHIDGGTCQVTHELKKYKSQEVITKTGTADIIAGNAASEAAGKKWRDDEEAANRKPGDPPSARLSTSSYGQYGFMAGYFKDGAWKFVAQELYTTRGHKTTSQTALPSWQAESSPSNHAAHTTRGCVARDANRSVGRLAPFNHKTKMRCIAKPV